MHRSNWTFINEVGGAPDKPSIWQMLLLSVGYLTAGVRYRGLPCMLNAKRLLPPKRAMLHCVFVQFGSESSV